MSATGRATLGLEYEDWMRNLADKRLRNGALVAMDYQTGELIAYVGSAGSHLDMPVQNWNNPDPGLGDVQARKPCGNRLLNVVWSES